MLKWIKAALRPKHYAKDVALQIAEGLRDGRLVLQCKECDWPINNVWPCIHEQHRHTAEPSPTKEVR